MASRQRTADPTHSDRVRVLDAGDEPPAPTPPGTGLLWALVGVVGLMVAGLWAFGGLADSPAVEATATPPPPIAAPAPQVPDVVGLRIQELSTAMSEAGFTGDSANPRQRWIANATVPEGVIVEQDPAPRSVLMDGRLDVVISAGGPVVGFADIPPDVRAWAATLPGFDSSEPVMIRATAAGPVYKTDTWLFGECEPVALAAETFPDGSYGEDCIVRITTDVSGVMPDGTTFAISDLPAGSYRAEGLSGAVMIGDEAGYVTLGIARYGRIQGLAAPNVEWLEDVLRVEAGGWYAEISVRGNLVQDDGTRDELAAAIHPGLVDGYLVIALDSPLRFQGPGEAPSRVGVDFGSFRVVAGCVTGVTNVVCDASRSISVEGATSGFELTGVTVRADEPVTFDGAVGTRDAEGRVTVVEESSGLEVTYPDTWQRAGESLTPSLVWPREVMSLGTFPLRPGGRLCGHMPENALRDMGAADALVSLQIAGRFGSSTNDTWPPDFGPDDLPPGDGTHDANVCAERPDLDIRWDRFYLQGAALYVLVAFGDQVDESVEQEVWDILESAYLSG